MTKDSFTSDRAVSCVACFQRNTVMCLSQWRPAVLAIAGHTVGYGAGSVMHLSAVLNFVTAATA